MASSIDRLTKRERDVLKLLAQGHTAKTIATAEGLTINAVNERLRSARRKTNAVSSRELARLLEREEDEASQESCPKIFDVGSSPPPGHSERGALAVGAGARATIGRTIVIAAILTGAALLAYQTSVPLSSARSTLAVSTQQGAVEPREYQIYFEQDDGGLSQGLVTLRQAVRYGGPHARYQVIGHWVQGERRDVAAQRANSIGIALRTYDIPGDQIVLETQDHPSRTISNAERRVVVVVTP